MSRWGCDNRKFGRRRVYHFSYYLGRGNSGCNRYWNRGLLSEGGSQCGQRCGDEAPAHGTDMAWCNGGQVRRCRGDLSLFLVDDGGTGSLCG